MYFFRFFFGAYVSGVRFLFTLKEVGGNGRKKLEGGCRDQDMVK